MMLFSVTSGRSLHCVSVWLVCLAVASVVCCSSTVGSSNNITMCLESESHALLQFKQGLVDDSNALASWKTEKDCCKWRGIACNPQTGHVTNLDFSFIRSSEVTPLRGELISPSLLELPYLNFLDLSFNDFEGVVIPKVIGSLSQLKELRLAYANFGGPIPPQLGNLSKLHTLDLSSDPIEVVYVETLEWLSHLSSLRNLVLSGLGLSKIVNWPQSLSKFTSLRELRLTECNLPDVNVRSLSSINYSTSLQLLDLSNNYFLNSSIFYWMANVSSNFVHIYLSGNNLHGPIPDHVFTNIHSLATLDMSHNYLEGRIPESFQKLCSLESLSLSVNQLSENIEDSLNTLSCAGDTLETLDLSDNLFWGSLEDLERFPKLRELNLYYNTLNGSLSNSVGQLSSLESLYLFGNSLSGVITESYFLNLSRLRSMDIAGNHFSFNLSSNWSPPFLLTGVLNMSFYKLGPSFPKWILVQKNITSLHLSNAGLSGALPNKFWDLFSGLSDLDLSMNQIHGKLPNLSTLISLDFLNMSSNLLSGALPSISPMLNRLDLSNNMFSGSLSTLCATQSRLHAPELEYLILSDNLLSGDLPNCWMKFQSMEVLDLSKNKLSGRIPSSLGYLPLMVLRLQKNSFSGGLPSLENCTGLIVLDLGDNNLSGKIPTWMGGNLTNLLILSLRSNEFSGNLPFSICSLVYIFVLDISRNNVSGALPNCLNDITSLAHDPTGAQLDLSLGLVWKGIEIEFGQSLYGMRSIDMSSNYLVGEIPQSIVNMTGLISLNLSRNYLTGKLPENLGDMKMLESLDFSRNKISGKIPTSFSRLSYLGVLDISHNRLSGRIPLGTQLQSFSPSAYMGNLGLCGPPLTTSCPRDKTSQGTGVTKGSEYDHNKEHDNDGLVNLGFFISAVLGFVTGFWMVCGCLLLKSSWRYAYFKIMDDLKDWVYVKAVLYKAKMQRRFHK